MNYELFVSDFDGTLLRTDDTVSPRNVSAIKDFIGRGGIFTVCTGRNFESIIKRFPEIGLSGLDIPVMYLQGCCARFSESGKILFSETLSYRDTLEIAEYLTELGIYFHVYTADRIFAKERNEITQSYEKGAGVTINYVGPLLEFMKSGDPGFVKILTVTDKRVTDSFCAETGKRFQRSSISVFTSSPIFTEFVSSGGGKGNGLKKCAQHLGVPVSRTVGIGDEMNDLPLITSAGLGLAVENARPALKEAADFIVASNDRDGVAEAIEKFCF